MFITKKVTLSDTQRGLLFKDQRFVKVLQPGKYRFWSINTEINVEEYDVTNPLGIRVSERLRHLINLYAEKLTAHLQIVKTGDQEIACVYHQGQFMHLIEEAKEVAFWKDMPNVEIRKQDISQDARIPEAVYRALQTAYCEIKANTSALLLTVEVAGNQRALLFRNKQLVAILKTGIHYYWNREGDHTAEIVTINELQNITAESKIMWLIEQHEDLFFDQIIHWETASDEVGLLVYNAVMSDILAPGKRGAYWKTSRNIEVQKLKLTDDQQVIDPVMAKQFRNPREVLLQNAVRDSVVTAEVSDKHIAFLIVDGKLQQTLSAGAYAWWKFNHSISVRHLDMRLQNMEVNGQEILTKDRVSLRINLSAAWQIIEAEKVVQELTDPMDFLYRELQLALRSVISTRTLDELLEDKNLLNKEVLNIVTSKVAEYGISLKTSGVKDIILPGEMKEILAQVVEAQKAAEANLIRRREETQATRSLHNTAKVMENNPTLLRLKELEVLEKITSQINTLNVYGGLDGVMNDMIKLTDNR